MSITNPNGNPTPLQLVADRAERKASRAESQADRAFDLALETSGIAGALQHAHQSNVELMGKLAGDMANHRASTAQEIQTLSGKIAEAELARQKHEESVRGALMRLELNAGTRSRASLAEEALAKSFSVDADVKKSKIEITRMRYAMGQRILAGVGTVLLPLAIALVTVLIAQVNGCSVIPGTKSAAPSTSASP